MLTLLSDSGDTSEKRTIESSKYRRHPLPMLPTSAVNKSRHSLRFEFVRDGRPRVRFRP